MGKWQNEKKLQNDLAQYFRDCGYLTFTEMEVKGTDGRADVATVPFLKECKQIAIPETLNLAVLPKTYSRFMKELRCYEVKISRACFLDDVKSEKYKKYMKVFPRVYYAVPKGLVKKEEVPEGVGLIVRNESSWYVEKTGVINKDIPNLDINTVLAFLFHGYEENRKVRRISDKITSEENYTIEQHAHYIGEEISKLVDRHNERKYEGWIKVIAEALYEYFGIELYRRNGEPYLPEPIEIEHLFKVLSKYKEDPDIDRCLDRMNDSARRKCFSFDGSSRKLIAEMKRLDKKKQK